MAPLPRSIELPAWTACVASRNVAGSCLSGRLLIRGHATRARPSCRFPLPGSRQTLTGRLGRAAQSASAVPECAALLAALVLGGGDGVGVGPAEERTGEPGHALQLVEPDTA